MKRTRPVNLDLTTIKFPPTAIASILHRIAGTVMFLALPVLLCLLGASLQSASGFASTQQCLQAPLMKIIMSAILLASSYHLLAGIRHIIMDLGFGEEFKQGRNSALLVMALTAIAAIAIGVWLW